MTPAASQACRIPLTPRFDGPSPRRSRVMTTATSLRLFGVCAVVAVLSLVRYAPEVTVFDPAAGFGYAVARVPDLKQQLADPAGWESHPSQPVALRWRLLPPTVGHLLHMRWRSYFAVPLIGAAILLMLTVAWTYEETRSVGWAALTGTLVTTSSWFFVSTGWLGQFDAFYLLGVMAVVFAPSSLAVWAACTLAPWCDERFLLILPACLCLRWARSALAERRRSLLVAGVGIAPYVALRLWAVAQGDGSIGSHLASQEAELRGYLPHLPLGWWMGFRAGWALIGIGIVAAAGALPRGGRLLLALSLFAGLAAIAVLAWDVSRSIAVLLPFLVHGAIVLRQRWPDAGWKPVAAAAALNLLIPASHVVEFSQIHLFSLWARIL